MKQHLRQILLITLCAWGALAQAASPVELIVPLQTQWADIKYQWPQAQQAELYHALALQARQLAQSHPELAEPLVWEGIALSSEAGARSGLGALSLAKEARQRFDAANQINAQALNAAASTSLATLYAKVPGWPLGFGDKAIAEGLFKKALAVAPRDIDANFFYGDFLAEEGRTADAITYLQAALRADARPGRALADQGRRQEIAALLNKLKS